MLINCTNKGCMEKTNALLDKDTREVICQECGKPIANITEMMKRVLQTNGEIVRSQERKAFLIACRNCRANRDVVLNDEDETICKICHEPIIISPTFRLAMEEAGIKLQKIDTNKDDK